VVTENSTCTSQKTVMNTTYACLGPTFISCEGLLSHFELKLGDVSTGIDVRAQKQGTQKQLFLKKRKGRVILEPSLIALSAQSPIPKWSLHPPACLSGVAVCAASLESYYRIKKSNCI
jgi:hypothetical protein